MRIRHELLVALSGFLILQWMTSTTAIVLLQRADPQVQSVIDENEAFRGSINKLATALATSGDEGVIGVNAAVAALLAADPTPQEALSIHQIARSGPAACLGDRAARVLTVDALSRLITLHDVYTRASEAKVARTLSGGSWAAVALALSALGASVVLVKRTDAQLFGPVQDLADAVQAYQQGDKHRRARSTMLPPPFGTIAQTYNELLDAACTVKTVEAGHLDQAALVKLLDALDGPAAILRTDVGVHVASADALALLHAQTPPTTRVKLSEQWTLVRWDQPPAA